MKKTLQIIIVLGLILCMSNAVAHAEVLSETYHVNKNYDLVPNDPKDLQTNKKVILITIDDGPSIYGRSMVATLSKHKAHAIFFINGIHDKANHGNILFEYQAGNAIGNHTWDHPNLKKITDQTAQKEIDSNSNLIKNITGAVPLFFRSPYGVSSEYSRALVLKEGMISMNWSGAAKDWEASTKNENVMLKNVMGTLHPGEILLIHEHEWTAKYLDDILTEIEAKGYTFVDPKNVTK